MAHLGRDHLHHRHEIHELALQSWWRRRHRSGHALKPLGVPRCGALARAAVSHPTSGSTRPVVSAPLVFTAARPPPAPRCDALPPPAARHPRISDSISRGIRTTLCRWPSQCRLPPVRQRKPTRGRRTARHRTGALAGPGAGLPEESRLFLPAPARGHRDHPVRIGHRCHQLLFAVPTSWAISTAGARPNPRWLSALLAQGYIVYCGFDADGTGENLARQMMALYPRVRRLRPCLHDWNEVLRWHPQIPLPLPSE